MKICWLLGCVYTACRPTQCMIKFILWKLAGGEILGAAEKGSSPGVCVCVCLCVCVCVCVCLPFKQLDLWKSPSFVSHSTEFSLSLLLSLTHTHKHTHEHTHAHTFKLKCFSFPPVANVCLHPRLNKDKHKTLGETQTHTQT